MGVKEALLVLRDGRTFRGEALGAQGETSGEVIFNTAMSGYQEILTDPSYRGQIVTMTYPMIGNYGCNDEDVESRRPWANGLIVKEASPYPSSWRGRISLDQYLKNHGIVGLQGIDTRALTGTCAIRARRTASSPPRISTPTACASACRRCRRSSARTS